MRGYLTLLMSALIIPPPSLLASEPAGRVQTFVEASSLERIHSVELNADGVLLGQLVDSTGASVAETELVFQSRSGESVLRSDKSGRFTIIGLRTGVCAVRCGNDKFAFRVWAWGTAPPDASSSVALVIESNSLVRGNRASGRRSQKKGVFAENRLFHSDAKYGIAILALGATATYFALSRDNAS